MKALRQTLFLPLLLLCFLYTQNLNAEPQVFPAKTKTLQTKNSSGRSGKYFLPENYNNNRLPLLVILHGSSIDGSAVLNIFKGLAKKRNFIIVAPDSVNTFGWQISDNFSDPSEDMSHIYDAINEVTNIPKVKISKKKILIAGISAGGAVATYLGSNDTYFKKMADLHGGVLISLLGDNVIPTWLSTGTTDTLRTPQELRGYETKLKELGYPSVTYSEYPVPHQIAAKEKTDLINWWLGKPKS